MPQDVLRFIQDFKRSERFADQIVHHEILPAREAAFKTVSRPWPHPILRFLNTLSLNNLYVHQAEALDAIRLGRHTVLASPTASGKTLVYTLPVLEQSLTKPHSRSLFLFPLKALAQDQLRTFQDSMQAWPLPEAPRAAIFDGDTPKQDRLRLRREPPTILMSNPEMLHLSLMPQHRHWSHFLKDLDFVVIDEVHTYRGVTGSNMAWVFRRLRRVCRYYGADPVFIFCSATVGNPRELAETLSGLSVQPVCSNGSPQGSKHFLLVNPLTGAAQSALLLLQAALSRGLRTIIYSQSRKMTELLGVWAARQCAKYAERISAYRSGFLPEERREIEARLSSGELLAVITTSALELGIDIGTLDICLLLGYPGSIMATWQRGGRVGRQQQDSGIILLGQENSLDQYFMANPKALFALKPEQAVLNPSNPMIMDRHLLCAAADLELDPGEDFLQEAGTRAGVKRLEDRGELLADVGNERYFPRRKNPAREVNLRGFGRQMRIINHTSRRSIGSIDAYRALHETHPGAVYLHRGKTFVIDSLQFEHSTIQAKRQEVNYFTRVRTDKHTEIVARHTRRRLLATGISLGQLRITERITGYEKRLTRGQKLLEVVPLDLEPLIFETEGFWLEIPAAARDACEKHCLHFMGGIHALEHALIGILPLLVLTDRRDLGGISQPVHPQLNNPAVFVYDGQPGGLGLSRTAFERAEDMLERTLAAIRSCPCELGCPGCIHSPKCGSGNRPLDKHSALFILGSIMGRSSSSPGIGRPAPSKKPVPPPDPKPTDAPSAAAFKPTRSSPAKRPSARPRRYGVLDLETQRSAQDVGGWNQAREMGISCVVVYDSLADAYLEYRESDIRRLIEDLQQMDLVVGFNIKRFDYQVLKGYTDFPLHTLPCLDLLLTVHSRLGYRVSLDNLAGATLGTEKSASGLQALAWWKQGAMDKIMAYCKQDVRITRDLYLYAREQGHLFFRNKARKKVRVPLELTFED